MRSLLVRPVLALARSPIAHDGSLSAWFVDRMLPSLVSGLFILVFGFFLNRSIRTHVDTSTAQQTEQLTTHLSEVTTEQTTELRQRRPPRMKPTSPGDGSGKVGGSGKG